MDYVLVEWSHELEDEPVEIYSQLDEARREVRRVEFYRSGLCFSYGGERGGQDVLADAPFPRDLRTLNKPGEVQAHAIPAARFEAVWPLAQERPDGFMGLFF